MTTSGSICGEPSCAGRPGSRLYSLVRVVLSILLAVGGPLASQAEEHLGRTAEQWQAGLDSARGIERLLAARSIGEMAIAGMDGASEALFEALGHADGSVRYWAAVAAVNMPEKSERLIDTVSGMLQDDVPEVRVQAAQTLTESSHREAALETIRQALRHPNRGVRLQAAHAADAIGDKARPLADALRVAVSDSFDYVQRVARHALWAMGERPCPYRDCD